MLIAIALLLGFVGTLVFFGADREIAGVSAESFGMAAYVAAFGAMAAAMFANALREDWRTTVQGVVFWTAATLILVAGYSYRQELTGVATRVAGDLAPGLVSVGPTGEVTVTRGRDGSFRLQATLGGAQARFVFDTGASTVVLTPETARAAGIDMARLSYSAVVSTANGRTTAAPVTLPSLAIGPIVERDVRALVAREGALFENLLGMSFLDRLASYQVEGDRLILRGR